MNGFGLCKRGKAFTLIELLIVVLIIAILAAIAVPNFLEFQTRAKVTRAMSDMRNLKTGLEAYRVDNGAYIRDLFGVDMWGTWAQLTTPIAYMSTIPPLAFQVYELHAALQSIRENPVRLWQNRG